MPSCVANKRSEEPRNLAQLTTVPKSHHVDTAGIYLPRFTYTVQRIMFSRPFVPVERGERYAGAPATHQSRTGVRYWSQRTSVTFITPSVMLLAILNNALAPNLLKLNFLHGTYTETSWKLQLSGPKASETQLLTRYLHGDFWKLGFPGRRKSCGRNMNAPCDRPT